MENMSLSEKQKFIDDFILLPVEEKTEELCMNAISIEPYLILHIDNINLLTENLLIEAAKKDGYIVSWLSNEHLTQNVCEEAVKRYGHGLQYAPDEYITEKMCLDAVKQDGTSIMFVPEKFITKEICNEAMKYIGDSDRMKRTDNNEDIDIVLANIPFPELSLKLLKSLDLKKIRMSVEDVYFGIHPKAFNENILKYLIRKDANIIQRFGKGHINADLCLYAVKRNGFALRHVPNKLFNEDICKEALKNKINSIQFVPENLKTKELLSYAVSRNAFVIEQINEKHLTRELCEKAIKTNQIIGNIPYPDLCMKMWDKLVSPYDYLDMLDKMHPKGWDEKFAEKVINTWGIYLEYVPENLITEKLCFEAVRNDGLALKWVPDEYLSKEMCLKAIDNTPAAIKFMPEDFHNEQFYRYLIERDAHNLIGIPQDFITHEMCKNALENTYFKDNNDVSLIMHINRPDIMLRVLESKKDIKGLEFSLICSCPKAFDDKVLKHIIEHRRELISSIPLKYLKDSVWEKAIGENPCILKNVNPKNVTPEMCLIAVKGDPEMKKHVPPSISSANNIYTFCMDMEKKYNLNLSVKDAKDLYEGKPLKIDRINTEKGILSNQIIKKDPLGPNISVQPLLPSKKAGISKRENISGNKRKSGVKPKF